ncbi:MAG: hypothetical protein LBS16_03395 [Prevotellaceae bacterium]|jgi:hypothetical protein|nr:hypothetical protein [Prevotellaceae bacterium]
MEVKEMLKSCKHCGQIHNEDEMSEKYEFTWPGKQNAKKIAFVQTSATLRPCEKESQNFETTENLYIEGDNLEVLKILQKSYYNKIKMIYIEIMTTRLIQFNFASVGRFQGGANVPEGCKLPSHFQGKQKEPRKPDGFRECGSFVFVWTQACLLLLCRFFQSP